MRLAGPISGKQTPHSDGEALEQRAPERALIIWPWLAQIGRYSCMVKTIGTSGPSARRAERSACTPKPMTWWKLTTSGRRSRRKRSKWSVRSLRRLLPRLNQS